MLMNSIYFGVRPAGAAGIEDGRLGWTLSAATAQIVADLVTADKPGYAA